MAALCLTCHRCWLMPWNKVPWAVVAVCSCHCCVHEALRFDGVSFKAVATWRALFCLPLGPQGLRIWWAWAAGPAFEVLGPSPESCSFPHSQQDQSQSRQFCDSVIKLWLCRRQRKRIPGTEVWSESYQAVLGFVFPPPIMQLLYIVTITFNPFWNKKGYK